MSLPFWSRHVKRVSQGDLWIFAVFPLSQILLIAYFFFLWMEYRLGAHMLVFIVLLGALCILTDLILLRALRQLPHRWRSQERTRMLSEQLERQKLHFESLVRDVEAGKKIRSGIAAEIRHAYALLDKREEEAARRRLDGVLAAFSSHSKCFCPHTIVDALMADKAQLCDERGIHLTYDLDVPEELPISGVELCAVFANVLDNAISACGVVQGIPFIDLKARTAGGFFVLKAVNSATTAFWKRRSGSLLSEHGWGLSILREIAARHDGELKTEQTAHTFQTTLWLKL